MSSGSTIVWVDIPARDLDRAINFYSAALGIPVEKHEYPGGAMGIFPHGDTTVGGCLFTGGEDLISDRGPLIYLNVDGRLDEAVASEPQCCAVIRMGGA
jgi:predicted enzyme related to lactoylglutathione lyase